MGPMTVTAQVPVLAEKVDPKSPKITGIKTSRDLTVSRYYFFKSLLCFKKPGLFLDAF